ncbi:MAG TPA: ester cyclase [Chloroflexota bacterium]|nr:ester cyclase [Chloroflexota bacterium]
MAVDVKSSDATKALVRRAIAYNHGVSEQGDEIFAPDFVAHMPSRPPMDRHGLDRFIGRVTGGLSEFGYEIEDQIAQGDIVYNRITAHGVHSAELFGVPASGRQIEMRIINQFKVRDGRVVEQWAEPDLFGLLRKIGAVPG